MLLKVVSHFIRKTKNFMKYFKEEVLKYFKISMKFLNISKSTRNSCTGHSPVQSIGHARSCRRRVAAYWIEQTWRSQKCKYLP